MTDKDKTIEKHLSDFELTTKDNGLLQARDGNTEKAVIAGVDTKPNIDDKENWDESKLEPGSLLSIKNKIDTAYKVSSNQLEEIDAGNSVLILSALKNKSTDEEAIMFLYEQSKYLIVLTDEEFDKSFTINDEKATLGDARK